MGLKKKTSFLCLQYQSPLFSTWIIFVTINYNLNCPAVLIMGNSTASWGKSVTMGNLRVQPDLALTCITLISCTPCLLLTYKSKYLAFIDYWLVPHTNLDLCTAPCAHVSRRRINNFWKFVPHGVLRKGYPSQNEKNNSISFTEPAIPPGHKHWLWTWKKAGKQILHRQRERESWLVCRTPAPIRHVRTVTCGRFSCVAHSSLARNPSKLMRFVCEAGNWAPGSQLCHVQRKWMIYTRDGNPRKELVPDLAILFWGVN